MEELINIIKAYKHDHPEVVITDNMIKELINYYKDEIVKEIREEL